MKTVIGLILFVNLLFSAVIDDYLNTLKVQAQTQNPNFKDFSVKRGNEIFNSKHLGKRGEVISCASCHGEDFTKTSKHYFTGKLIQPLSPKVNPERLSDIKSIEKWLRRNFNDVYKREGTAQEKGDVLYYILSKDK